MTECWPPATAAFARQNHFESSRFEHCHRRHPDMRLVIAHKRVVPKQNSSPRGGRRDTCPTACAAFVAGEPVVKAFLGVMRQWTLLGDSPSSRQQSPQPWPIEGAISQCRRGASELA